MFHKILIGSDGSEGTENAAILASEIAKRFASQTVVLNACDLSIAVAGDAVFGAISISPEIVEECVQGERAAAESAVKPILASLQPPYRMLQELGHPVDAILKVAEREKADLIVVGSRGQSRLEELFLGSVSLGVLHHAHCPVLIEHGRPRPIRRILLASDGSAGSWKAAEAACALAKGFEACLSVLQVNESTGGFHTSDIDPYAVRTFAYLQGSGRRNSVEASLDAATRETDNAFQVCAKRGHAGERIVRYAEDEKFDLIVMGSRGLGGFARMLLGSVSNYVVHHTHCPLLVVR